MSREQRPVPIAAGTILQDTRKALVDWFRAMYWLAGQFCHRRRRIEPGVTWHPW
jgi:hypothetical protein